MPRPAEVSPRPPGDYAAALATKEPVLIVGGQAVNLWALQYLDQTRDLAPFTSRDADILGDAETLRELAKLAGEKPQLFPLRPPTNEVGVVIAKDATGQPMLIEVLRHVHGAKNQELRDSAYAIALGSNQVTVKVPGPITLLRAKLANVTDLSQTGRQDARHVAILARIMPAYLGDLEKSARAGKLDERKLIGFLEQLLTVLTLIKYQRTLADLAIDPRSMFAALKPEELPRLQAFLEKRLPRALPKPAKAGLPQKRGET